MGAGVIPARAHGKAPLYRKWVVAGGVGVVAAVALLVVVILKVTSSSVVQVGNLESAVLGAEQINTIMGTTDMRFGEVESAPGKPALALSRVDCVGALAAAQAPTSIDTGYAGLRWSAAKETGDEVSRYVAQPAAVFSDADRAGAFVKNSADQWKACAAQPVTVVQADKSVVTWRLGALAGLPPTISVWNPGRTSGGRVSGQCVRFRTWLSMPPRAVPRSQIRAG